MKEPRKNVEKPKLTSFEDGQKTGNVSPDFSHLPFTKAESRMNLLQDITSFDDRIKFCIVLLIDSEKECRFVQTNDSICSRLPVCCTYIVLDSFVTSGFIVWLKKQ